MKQISSKILEFINHNPSTKNIMLDKNKKSIYYSLQRCIYILVLFGFIINAEAHYNIVMMNMTTDTTNNTTPPTIIYQPASSIKCSGDSVNFSITATGAGVLSYQWKKIVDSESLIVDSTLQSTFTINSVATTDAGYYFCIVSDSLGSISSDTVELIVKLPPVFTLQPVAFSGCQSTAANFQVSATGSDTLRYQWWKNGNQLSVTSSQLTLNNIQEEDAGEYYCVVGNGCGSVTSDTVSLSVKLPPEIAQQPESVNIAQHSTVSFTLTADSVLPLSYQWMKKGNHYSLCSNSQFTMERVDEEDGGKYYCKVLNECGTSVSDTATLSVYKPITLKFQPKADTIYNWETARFRVIASGTMISYQWQEIRVEYTDSSHTAVDTIIENLTDNNVSLQTMNQNMYSLNSINQNEAIYSGSTSSELTINNIEGLEGRRYRCIISGEHSETLTSNEATLIINNNVPVGGGPQTPAEESMLMSLFTHYPNPDYSKAVGTTAGAVNVDLSGAATYNIPITVAPGTAGMAPNVSLIYNSRGGEDVMGMGWGISGLSSITRTGRNYYNDGIFGEQGINFTEDDRFMLDGNRLILVEGTTYGIPGTKYRTENEMFINITYTDRNESNIEVPPYFKIETKDGRTIYYGRTDGTTYGETNSKEILKDNQNTEHILRWCITETRDKNGNYVRYKYENENSIINGLGKNKLHIQEIDYTGNINTGQLPYNSIKFIYNDINAPIPHVLYLSGCGIINNKILNKIDIYNENDITREYDLEYTGETTKYLTSLIEQSRTDNTKNMEQYNPIVFTYGSLSPIKSVENSIKTMYSNTSQTSQESEDYEYIFADLDGDGKTEIIKSIYDRINTKYSGFAIQKYNTGSGGIDNILTQNLNSRQYDHGEYLNGVYEQNYLATDFEGNGKISLIEVLGNNESSNGFKHKLLSKIDIINSNVIISEIKLDGTDTNYVTNNITAHHTSYYTGNFIGNGKSQLLIMHSYETSTNSNYVNIRIDIFGFNTETSGWEKICMNDEINFEKPNGYDINSDANIITGNFSGNGKEEILLKNDQNYLIGFDNNTGNFAYTELTPNSTPIITPRWLTYTGDFNGDGLTDVLTNTSYTGDWAIYFSNGKGFETEQENVLVPSLGNPYYGTNEIGHNYEKNILNTLLIGDYNGDGKTDILKIYFYKPYCAQPCEFYNPLSSCCTGDFGQLNFKIDIYYSTGSNFIKGENDNSYETDFPVSISNSSLLMIEQMATKHGFKTYSTLDVNGDGKTDLMMWDKLNERIYSFHPMEHERTLSSIKNGLGLPMKIDYKYLSEGGDIYIKTDNTQYPLISITAPIEVVSEVTMPYDFIKNVYKTSYKYEDAKLHLTGKGFLGFISITGNSYIKNIKDETAEDKQIKANRYEFEILPEDYTIDSPYLSIGMKKQTVYSSYSLENQEKLSETVYKNEVKVIDGKRIFQYNSSVEEKNYVNKTGRKTDYSYKDGADINNGNVSSVTVSDIKATDMTNLNYTNYEWKTMDEYIYNYGGESNNWTNLKSIKTRQWNKEENVEANAFELTKEFEYVENEPYTLASITENGRTKTSFVYGDFGNINSTTLHAVNSSSGMADRVSTMTYDTKGRFLLSTTNGLGQTTEATYNAMTGGIMTRKDQNGLVTTYDYDGFGRIKSKKMMTGQSETRQTETKSYIWGFMWGLTNPDRFPIDYKGNNMALYVVNKSKEGMADKTEYYDAFGRIIRNETTGYDIKKAGDLIYTDTRYNELGQVSMKSSPTWTMAEAKSQYAYDWAGRLTKVTMPTGAERTYTYDDENMVTESIEVTTNEGTQLQANKKQYDSRGNLIKTIDAKEGTVTYKYNNKGKPKEINTAGTIIKAEYDAIGNQTALEDPNAGKMSYTYDVFGELKTQTDAKGNTFTLEYDALGRLIKKRNADAGDVEYHYDEYDGILNSATNSTTNDRYNGALTWIKNQKTGYAHSYNYDEFGRLYQEKEYIDGDEYKTLYGIDDMDRVNTITYPSGVKIENVYTDNGYLSMIKNVSTVGGEGGPFVTLDEKIWEADKTNKTEIYEYRLGDGIVNMKKDYGDDFGLIYGTTAKNSSGGDLQKFSYGFNAATGNLTYRKDEKRHFTENFGYDELNRLTSIDNGIDDPKIISYQTNGNVKSKSDVSGEDYIYDSERPNAGASVRNSTGVIGNETQKINYTVFNKIEEIEEGTKRSEFKYGAEETRKMQIYKTQVESVFNTDSTTYYIGNYEKTVKTNDGAFIREVTYIPSPTGLAGVYIKDTRDATKPEGRMYYALTDHLGSITGLVDESGELGTNNKNEFSYDAWGRRRHADTWVCYTKEELAEYKPTISRGYTGHEHMDRFGLINMNGRLYDPVLGRMLSPDNYIQNPFSNAFNRYSYCWNNPLAFIDPSGDKGEPVLIGWMTYGTDGLGIKIPIFALPEVEINAYDALSPLPSKGVTLEISDDVIYEDNPIPYRESESLGGPSQSSFDGNFSGSFAGIGSLQGGSSNTSSSPGGVGGGGMGGGFNKQSKLIKTSSGIIDVSELGKIVAGTGISIAENKMFNQETWFSIRQLKSYSQKFNGNQYTWGKLKVANKVATGFKIAGWGLGLINAKSIFNQYQTGQIDKTQMIIEESSNAFSTFGSIFGAAWALGWESGRAITKTNWYQDFKQDFWNH